MTTAGSFDFRHLAAAGWTQQGDLWLRRREFVCAEEMVIEL